MRIGPKTTMEKIEREIAQTDPSTPFRATKHHIHHTWARTFQSRPELYIRPESLAEIQKLVTLARRCRRRIVVVGCGHSPSDLTCSSSWMVNLDNYSRVLKVDRQKKTLLVEAGMRLRTLNEEASKHGLTMPNLGSINEQSIAGAIATATHGSSLKHGLMSESVRSLRIVLANGRAIRCSKDQNQDLFRAALVSLGAIGIITEVEFEMIDDCRIEWEQTLTTLDDVLTRWETTLWTQREYTRVWWMPYMKRAIVWSAEKTSKPLRPPKETWYGGSVGFHTYHNLLWLSNYIPSILPAVEWFVFGMQYGFSPGITTSAVEPLRQGLLMNCLYSQFVNEWALPLVKGPEAISRLSSWLNREPGGGGIPFSAKGLYVHCPIEVRVSDSTHKDTPRPFLDNSYDAGPTLYLNATLYRAYHVDPPCRERYYEAFEWLMRDLGAKPHYAKNFSSTSSRQIQGLLGEGLRKWVAVRNEADPEGMFLGEWHRRSLGIGGDDGAGNSTFALAEREVHRIKVGDGSQLWSGRVIGSATAASGAGESSLQEGFIPLTTAPDVHASYRAESPSASSSGESFDMMHGAEAEKSVLFDGNDYDDDDDDEGGGEDDGELTDRDERRYHAHAHEKITGTAVFDKM